MRNLFALVGAVLAIFGAAFLVQSLKIDLKPGVDISKYYPTSSFKIPKELLQEMIASKSATVAKIPIIMYHYIEYADKNDPGRVKLSVPPSLFEAQLQAIKRDNFQTMFAREVPDLIVGRLSVPRPIVLTFDDGYADFYYYAFPLLKKYNMKATMYIVESFIGRKDYMSAAQIKEIIASGMVELGGHTLDHADLSSVKNVLAWKEIYDSKILLERQFGVSVPSFAYPYGGFSKDTVDLVRKAGYTNAVSVIPGIYQSDTNLYFLFRIRPGYINTSNFAKSLDAFQK